MFLSITNSGPDATDLGFLLHKNPANVHTSRLGYGSATVFYPDTAADESTAVLLVNVDPVALVRSKGAANSWALGQYVNDRPYVASSFLSTAIARVYGSALNGVCAKRPELIAKSLDLTVKIPVLPAPGGHEMLERLFLPLGYDVTSDPIVLDPHFPDWGESRYRDVTLKRRCDLKSLLRHLFVIIPALDNQKHYWIGQDEIEKLLTKGEGWLEGHPEKEWIISRYLKRRMNLAREALQRLVSTGGDEGEDQQEDAKEPAVERKISLHTRRLDRVAELIESLSPASVVDLGCGEGKLLARLLRKTKIPKVTGMDVDSRSLGRAQDLLVTKNNGKYGDRLNLIQGSLIYRDSRLEGHDVAALVEVIEHLDPNRLEALERVVFGCARPTNVIMTTPNVEYNVLFESMSAGQFRHRDHRFEWTRAEFENWAQSVASAHSYRVVFEPLGDVVPELGAPSQLAHFFR